MRSIGLVMIAVLAACGSSNTEQVVAGQASLSSFPTPVTSVQVLQGDQVLAESPVATDGRFRLSLKPGSGLRVQFTGGSDPVDLVFPRSGGSIVGQFDVLGAGAPFDLGMVRYVPDLSTASFRFTAGGVGSTSTALTDPEPGDDDDVECEDGIDAVTGAVCVDDDADDGEMCGEEEEGEDGGEAEADDDDVECEDGLDPATGLECDGGPAANADDGTEDGSDDDDESLADGAVPDRNLPSAIGCGGEEDDDDHECEGECEE